MRLSSEILPKRRGDACNDHRDSSMVEEMSDTGIGLDGVGGRRMDEENEDKPQDHQREKLLLDQFGEFFRIVCKHTARH